MSSLDEALKVLLQMDRRSGYPQMIGFKLANGLATAASRDALSEAVARCVHVYTSARKHNLCAKLAELCTDFKITLLIAELASQA